MKILWLVGALLLCGCGDKIPEDNGDIDPEQLCQECFQDGCDECSTEPCEECKPCPDCKECEICKPPRCFERVEIWKGNPEEGYRFNEIPCDGVL